MTYVYDDQKFDTLKEAVRVAWDDLNESDKVELWNEYCDNNRYYDERIYGMDELDDLYMDSTPSEILNLAYGNDFNPRSYYFRHTGYGLESADYPDGWMEFDDIKDWLIDNYDRLDIEEVDEDEEDEDEE